MSSHPDSAMRNQGQAVTREFSVFRIEPSRHAILSDTVAVEEPLERRLVYWFKDVRAVQSLGLTMRTPGHDGELMLGSLLSEGVIRTRGDVIEVRHLGTPPSNEITAELGRHVDAEAWRLARANFISSSCGVCGKRALDSIDQPFTPPSQSTMSVHSRVISQLPDTLLAHQAAFTRTGGLHAAALATSSGEILQVFEDVGRHNALDKLLGWCVLQDLLPLENKIVFLTSRSSFELVQKVVVAGGHMIATVGAPSSLAVETARTYGITLVGFVRGDRFNVYAGEGRINWG
ncbi:MAG: formate dehydrogenase accessory sulfurtransferase FdhD [Bryobacteraceae bacterium]